MKLPKPPDTATDPKQPKSTWDKVVTSTPVIMTVLATILAGVSSSEMSQAQYFMSLSARNQSKAGDQWSFFQAKKLRAANSASTVDILQNLGDVSPLAADSFTTTAASLAKQLDAAHAHYPDNPQMTEAYLDVQSVRSDLAAAMGSADVKHALGLLIDGLPPLGDVSVSSEPKVQHAMASLSKSPADAIDATIFATVSDAALQEALLRSEQNADAADNGMKPATVSMDRLQKLIDRLAKAAASARRANRSTTRPSTAAFTATDPESPMEVRQLAADFTTAKLRFDAARHDREARLNQQTAYLYEIAVRKTSWESERHRIRSRYFFFGMLGAQAAVTIASLSLAVRERNWMWSVAAVLGALALSSAAYIYLFL